MKPLNSQERTKQFFIFLAFYALTTALVVVIFYFDHDLNSPANKYLLDENKKLSQGAKGNDQYLPAINTVNTLFDEIKNITNSDVMESEIERGNLSIQKSILDLGINVKDTTSIANQYFKLANSSIYFLQQEKKAKKQVEEFDKVKDDLKEAKKIIEDCKRKCSDC